MFTGKTLSEVDIISSTRICGKHFREELIEHSYDQRAFLKKTAIPIIFPKTVLAET